MIEVWGFSGPNVPAQGWSAWQSCTGICFVNLKLSFEYQYDYKLYGVSGEPAPAVDHTHSKEVVFVFWWHFLFGFCCCCYLCPMPNPVSGQEATAFYQVSGSLFIPLHQGFIYFPLSLFFSRLNCPSCLSLSSHERYSSSLRRGEGERWHLNISSRRAGCCICLFVLKDWLKSLFLSSIMD